MSLTTSTYFVLLISLYSSMICATPAKNTGYVTFRLDDLQDYWLTTVQQDIMNVFKNRSLPFTGCVIANSFGTDPSIVDYVKAAVLDPSWDFLVVNHGWNHEYFSTFNLSMQITMMKESINKTIADLDNTISKIDVFVPPFNDFNADTLTAMKEAGFSIISAMVDTDTYAIPGPDSLGLTHWPIDASTTDLSDVYVVTPEVTFAQIQAQMATYGYSSVMMHMPEFSMNGDDVTNTTMISELIRLIGMVEAAGYKFTTFTGLSDIWNGASTTGAASPITTHAASPVSTGVFIPATSSSITTAAMPSMTTGNSDATTGIFIEASTTRQPAFTNGDSPKPMTTDSAPIAPMTTDSAPISPMTTDSAPIVPMTTGDIDMTTSAPDSSTTGSAESASSTGINNDESSQSEIHSSSGSKIQAMFAIFFFAASLIL